MSHMMRKPVYAICEQQRCRSACAAAQSGQRLCCPVPLVSIPETSSLNLASVAAQAGVSLPWSQTLKTGFLVMRLKYCFHLAKLRLVNHYFQRRYRRLDRFQEDMFKVFERARRLTRTDSQVTADLKIDLEITCMSTDMTSLCSEVVNQTVLHIKMLLTNPWHECTKLHLHLYATVKLTFGP